MRSDRARVGQPGNVQKKNSSRINLTDGGASPSNTLEKSSSPDLRKEALLRRLRTQPIESADYHRRIFRFLDPALSSSTVRTGCSKSSRSYWGRLVISKNFRCQPKNDPLMMPELNFRLQNTSSPLLRVRERVFRRSGREGHSDRIFRFA